MPVKPVGLTCSVNYADFLGYGLDFWRANLSRLVVVTTPGDKDTLELCRSRGVETYCTDVFTSNGAAFNKGAALSEAVLATRLLHESERWVISFDADMVPPPDLAEQLDAAKPDPAYLYTARRFQINPGEPLVARQGRVLLSSGVVGAFMMFHADAPQVGVPLFRCDLATAAWYDSDFSFRWPRNRWCWLPIDLIHMGERRKNWLGRNNRVAMQRFLAQGKFEAVLSNPPDVLARARAHTAG